MSNKKRYRSYDCIQIITNKQELKEVLALRENKYKEIYPAIDVHQDNYDQSAVIFFGRDQSGKVSSSARLVIDGAQGLPEDLYFPYQVTKYRCQKLKLMELGRFIIQQGSLSLLKAYYQAFYKAAKQYKIDVILMAMKPKDVSFHKRLMGAKVLLENMEVTYGGQTHLSCVAWEIARTPLCFFTWIGVEK